MARRVPGPAGFALGAFVLVLVVVAAGRMLPFALEQRQITSAVPVPPPLFTISPIDLRPGAAACVEEVALDRRSGVAAIQTVPGSAPIQRLLFTASSGAYRARSAFRGGLGPHGDVAEASFTAPPSPRGARVCMRNAGRRPVQLVGTEELRTATRARTTIGGVPQADLGLTIYEPGRRSLLAATPAILDRAALYKAGFLRGWMLFPLALLVAFGVPAGVLWALAHGLRADVAVGAPR
jgi:hypothetical protein